MYTVKRSITDSLRYYFTHCSSIERFAQHEAKRTEQKAKGELERQKLQNEKEAEQARQVLLELQAVAAAVESSGQAKAEAQAQAERLLIEGQSAIECEFVTVDMWLALSLLPCETLNYCTTLCITVLCMASGYHTSSFIAFCLLHSYKLGYCTTGVHNSIADTPYSRFYQRLIEEERAYN